MVDGEEEKKNQLNESSEEQISKISKDDLEKKDKDKLEKENYSDSGFHSEKKIYLLHGKAERETVGWFNFDKKYLKVCLYALFVIFWGAIIFIMLQNWGATKAFAMNFCKVLSPFFVAVIIAYFVSPLFETYHPSCSVINLEPLSLYTSRLPF